MPQIEHLFSVNAFTTGLISSLYSIVWSLIPYVLTSLGLYTLAARRGIRHPWLAWVPVGNEWILGCISDQYQYVSNGRTKSKRKLLLALNIVMLAVCVITIVIAAAMFVYAIEDLINADGIPSVNMLNSLFSMLGLALLLIVSCIGYAVVRYMALYDLYASCEPQNKTLFLVLSILVPFAAAILVFLCRDKEQGMPPRRPQPEPHVPVEPWENRTEE